MQPIDPLDMHAAIERAWIVVWQAERLADTQATATLEYLAHTRAGGTYRASHRHPFHRLNADRRFLLLAARDLLRALDRIGERDRIPSDMRAQIELLRNYNEHWDERGGRAQRTFADAGGTDPFSQRWGAGGIRLAQYHDPEKSLDVDALVAVAQQVYCDLVAIEEGPINLQRSAPTEPA